MTGVEAKVLIRYQGPIAGIVTGDILPFRGSAPASSGPESVETVPGTITA